MNFKTNVTLLIDKGAITLFLHFAVNSKQTKSTDREQTEPPTLELVGGRLVRGQLWWPTQRVNAIQIIIG